MPTRLDIEVRHRPEVDPAFLPAVLWNRSYAAAMRATRGSVELGLALSREDGTVFTHRTRILPPSTAHNALNRTYVERLVKFLLWQKGGSHVLEPDFDRHIRGLFRALQEWWGGVPFEVVNDGEVTASPTSTRSRACWCSAA